MKKIILLIALTIGALQAGNVVHYDTPKANGSSIKANHPNNDR